MNNVKNSVSLWLCGSFVFWGCAGLKPGFTKEGAAVAVAAPTLEEARRAAVRSSLELFLSPASPAWTKTSEALAARASEFVGRESFKKGKGAIELRFGRLLAALDKEGLLRPAGFTSREPRVLLLVSEPQGILDLGVGPAADALRRGLSAYGMTAVDGRDHLNEFLAKGSDPASLAAGAARLGSDWMIVGAASASAERDPASGMWRGRAGLITDAYGVRSSTPVAQSRSEASVLDVSSAAARGKALEQAGEDAAAKTAAAIKGSIGGRSEAAVFVAGGGPDLSGLKTLLASLRGAEGVAGAYLGVWSGQEEGVVVRVFVAGMKTDDLAARLLRRDPTLTLVSIETENGRLAVELPGGRAE